MKTVRAAESRNNRPCKPSYGDYVKGMAHIFKDVLSLPFMGIKFMNSQSQPNILGK